MGYAPLVCGIFSLWVTFSHIQEAGASPFSASGNGRPGVRSGAVPDVLAKPNAVFSEAMRDPTAPKRFPEIDLQSVGGSGADVQTLIRAEAQKWGKRVREKNITAE